MLVCLLPVFFYVGSSLGRDTDWDPQLGSSDFRVHSQSCPLSLHSPSDKRSFVAAGTTLHPSRLFATAIIIPDALRLYCFISFIWNVLETFVLWILTSIFLYIASLYFWAVGRTSCTYKNMNIWKARGGFLAFSCLIHDSLRPTLTLRSYQTPWIK